LKPLEFYDQALNLILQVADSNYEIYDQTL
jgi:hypothetical protein